MLQLRKNGITFELHEGAVLSIDPGHGEKYIQQCTGWAMTMAEQGVDSIRFTAQKEGMILHGTYELMERNGCPGVRLTLRGEEWPKGVETVAFPGAFIPRNEDLCVNPFFEGVVYPAADEQILPKVQFMSGLDISMSFYGMLSANEGSGLLCAVWTNADAQLHNGKSENDRCISSIHWMPQKNAWAYDRVMEFVVIPDGGLTALCKAYRAIAEEKGFVRPFTEKAKTVPAVQRLLGCANVWLWNDDAMDKLYAPDAQVRIPTQEQLAQRRRIAKDMHDRGMTRVLWSVFDENIEPDMIAYMKSLGYLTTFYDIYTDVIPKTIADRITPTRRKRCEQRMDWWPDGISIDEDGSLRPAWKLKGTDGVFYDQNRMCDRCAVECARQYIPKHTAHAGLDGRFIDVMMAYSTECWSEKHPLTRREAFQYKRELLQIMGDLGLVCGTEVGREECVPVCDYNEGLMSPTPFRPVEAGRRMTHIYEGEQVPPQVPEKMLNPQLRVPLWELVYHDCMISYWYWGDSSNCCPELTPIRDLYNVLYGLPAIYSFKVGDWERLRPVILSSYQRTAPVARAVGDMEMTEFRWLTPDRKVQQTRFSNGVTVTVNFSEKPFVWADHTIAPQDAYITGMNEN